MNRAELILEFGDLVELVDGYLKNYYLCGTRVTGWVRDRTGALSNIGHARETHYNPINSKNSWKISVEDKASLYCVAIEHSISFLDKTRCMPHYMQGWSRMIKEKIRDIRQGIGETESAV
jgi:hypothetical protein